MDPDSSHPETARTDMAESAPAAKGTAANREREFEALYTAHHRAVLAYCARRASRTDAWDAASEVFLVAWRRLDDAPPPTEARAWLLGVAYKVLSNQRRGTQRRRRLAAKATPAELNGGRQPDEQLIRSEDETAVIAALRRLRAADREILQLSLWEEMAPVDIATVLGISRAAVDQRYSRAKRRLAREMNLTVSASDRATQPNEGGAA